MDSRQKMSDADSQSAPGRGGNRRPKNGQASGQKGDNRGTGNGGGGYGSHHGQSMNNNNGGMRYSNLHAHSKTPNSNTRRRSSNSSYNGSGGKGGAGGAGGSRSVERRGSQDMRELTAALMQAREGTGDVVEILMCSAFRPRLPGLTKMLSKLGKEGSWKKALELYEAAVNIGMCEPDTALTNAVVSACDKGGQWQKALEYFDKFERMGIKRDAITYSATINALGKGRQWEAALKVFDHMKTSGVRADVVTCCSLINALEKSGQWEMAETLFYYMKGDPIPENNEVVAEVGSNGVGGFGTEGGGNQPQPSPNSVLKSVLRHNSLVSQLATLNEDNVVLPDDEFGSLGFILPPEDLIGTPVSAGSDHSNVSNASSISFGFTHEGLFGTGSNVHPSATSRRDSSSSAHSVGNSQVPQNLLMEFASLGMDDGEGDNGAPAPHQYGSLVSPGLGREGAQDALPRRSISCFPDMNGQDGPLSPSELARTIDFSHAHGVNPNRVCCNALMGAFARARPTQWKKAVDFVSYLWTQDESIQPDVITYNTALKACSSAFQVKQIEKLLGDMNDRGVSPNTATFQFIIEAATESRSSLFLKNVIAWLDDYPNLKDKCSSQLVVACIQCNMREEAIELFEDRLTANSHGVSEATEAVFSGLIMQRDIQAVIRLLDVMCEMRALPSMNVCSSLIDFLSSSNYWEPATNLLENMISGESHLSDRMLSVSTVNKILSAMCRAIDEGMSPSAPSPPRGGHRASPLSPMPPKDQAMVILPRAKSIFGWFGNKIPCRPNQESFRHMAHILSSAEEYAEVLVLNQMMTKQGCYPDEDTMSYILLASFERGDTSNAIRLMTQLMISGVVLSNAVISRGFEESLSRGEWQLAEAICESLEKRNVSHESIKFTYQTLLRKVLRAGDNGTAMKLLNSMRHKPYLQQDPLIGPLLAGMTSTGLEEMNTTNGLGMYGAGSVPVTNQATLQQQSRDSTPPSQAHSSHSEGSSLFSPDYLHSAKPPSNRDLIDNLLDEWVSTGFLPNDVGEDIRTMRLSDVCPRPENLLDIVRRVAESNSPGKAIDAVRMCCSLHTRADALDFFEVPNMYSRVEGGKHRWRQEINLERLCLSAGMQTDFTLIHVVVASWVLAAQEATSWGLGSPDFDCFNIRIRASSSEELGKISLGLIQLLTRGYSSVIPGFRGGNMSMNNIGLPRFHDASSVTLFQQDETSGVIQVNTNGLKCLS